MGGINTSAFVNIFSLLYKHFLYMFALFEFFRAGRPVCMTVGSHILYDSFCWVVSTVSSNAKFSFDVVCRCTKYLWFTARALRHSLFTKSCLILEAGRGYKISQIFIDRSAEVSDLFLIFCLLLSPNTHFLSVSPPGMTSRTFNIMFFLSLLLEVEKI